jgi:hypothetical protein
MVGLPLDYRSLFVWRNSDAADLAPDLKVGANVCASVFDLRCLHGSSRLHWSWQTASESAKPRQRYSPPYVCRYRRYRSAQVSMSRGAVLRHYDPAQTIWADGTCGNERRDTIAHRVWPRKGSQRCGLFQFRFSLRAAIGLHTLPKFSDEGPVVHFRFSLTIKT